MSLLIKALDSAERTKQAEKDKKQMVENAATPAALELEPLVSQMVDKVAEPEPALQKPTSTPEPSPDLGLTLAEKNKPANSFTLEDEAGLSNAGLTVSKYAKAKSASVKAPAPSAPLKRNLRETQSIAKPETTPNPIPPSSTIQAGPAGMDVNQKTAAKVFVANQAVKSASSKYALVALGVAGALILWLGLQGYTYIKPLFAPAVVIVKPATTLQPAGATAETAGIEQQAVPNTEQRLPTEAQAQAAGLSNSPSVAEAPIAASTPNTANPTQAFSGDSNSNSPAPAKTLANHEWIAERTVPANTVVKRPAIESVGLAASESLKVTSKTPSPGVDPTLLSAYKAFTRGDDSVAQQQYRSVLQKDVRNIDALLGMAAIAQRQGRHADAMGWFQKVLEIEPRNSIAQSAIIGSQSESDMIGSESRLKSMLASQPAGAHLHAALGNLFAEQNQWTLAQEAYFNASRFAPNNADYAFNLAISLDQLGKSSLALKQYQRALDLLNQSGASSPDRVLLEARIQALQ